MARLVEPRSLAGHAADNLQFIRDTMARASGFTAVPGLGGVMVGVTALVTAAVAGPVAASPRWLTIWMIDALVALVIGLVAAARKAKRADSSLADVTGRRFALAFAPALTAGAVLTVLFAASGMTARLPGCWLLLYGAGTSSGGALSVRPVPMLGLCLMALGVLALLCPVSWGNLFMAAGFGGLQIVFGAIIARHYGG